MNLLSHDSVASSAHLLDISTTERGARVSLWPVHVPVAATLSSYEEVTIDRREVERLTYELRVQLGRASARGVLDRAASDEIRKLGHLLFDELLPPRVKDWLRQREGGDLLIRTDESLLDIPWEMLHTGQAYLAMQMNIGRLIASPELHAPVTPRALRAPYNVLLLADPCGDLDEAYEEGIRLRDRLDDQPFLRVALQSSEISRAFVRENIREFDILHFAGHAEVGGQGPGWLLNDGRLTSQDIERLTGGRPFPSLVFANACGSGRSRRALDGSAATWSLARTFLGAGVRHFIGTHWDVPDRIASDFAEHFYRGLCAGLAVGAALRQARVAVSLIHGEGAILWGAYCLYGDPHHVYFPEAAEASSSPRWDEALPVVDVPEQPVRGIYHTMDVPVRDLVAAQDTAARGDGLGLHPNLRNEVALERTPGFGAVQDLTRPLIITAAIATLLLLAAIGQQVWLSFDDMIASSASSSVPAVTSTVPASPVQPPSPQPTEPTSPPANPVIVEQIRAREAADALAPPHLNFQVTAQTRTRTNDLVEVLVAEGTRLRSGDNLRVALKSDRDAYVALVLIDGRHRPQLLFPHPSVRAPQGNHLAAGESMSLPGDDLWFRLDRRPGVETLVMLASRKPLDGLEDFLDDLTIYGKASRTHRGPRGGVTVRGVGGVHAGKARRSTNADGARSRQLADVQTLARERGVEVVQAVTYIHVR